MMKVLQLGYCYYPHMGGIEEVTRNIAESLNKKQIEQKVLCFNFDDNADDMQCSARETTIDMVEGVEVIRCSCIGKLFSQYISFSYIKILERLMTDFQPDVVILHFPNPFSTFFLSRYYKKKMKLIVFYHLDIVRQRFLGKIFEPQTRKLLKRADKIIATSQNYIDGSRFLNSYRDKCAVVPNCINEKKLLMTKERESKAQHIKVMNAGKTICLSVGRLVSYKGYEYLIEASQYLDDDFIFYIVGAGPLHDELQQKAKDNKKIRFLGQISDDDLVAYLAACDIFCFPSITKNEAFGIALAEGMFFGKPAVTFTIQGSGVNYVNLNGLTGIECPNCDSRAYADALKKLKDDDAMRFVCGENASQRVAENFMMKQFNENIISIIELVNGTEMM